MTSKRASFMEMLTSEPSPRHWEEEEGEEEEEEEIPEELDWFEEDCQEEEEGVWRLVQDKTEEKVEETNPYSFWNSDEKKSHLNSSTEEERKVNAAPEEASEEFKESNEEVEEVVEDYESDFEDSEKSEMPEDSSHLSGSKKEETEAIAALEQALEKLRKENEQLEQALNKEQKERESLAKSKGRLQEEISLLKFEMTGLRTAQSENSSSLKAKETNKEENKEIKKLQKALEEKRVQHEEELSEQAKASLQGNKALRQQLTEQQEDNQRKEEEIQSLQYRVQILENQTESQIGSKDVTVSALEHNIKDLISELKEELQKNFELQAHMTAAVSEEKQRSSAATQKLQEELEGSQQELERLKRELKVYEKAQKELSGNILDLKKKLATEKKLREEQEAVSRPEERLWKEKPEEEEKLSGKNLELEKSLAAEKMLSFLLKDGKQCLEKVLQQTRRGQKPHLAYENETLRMENRHLISQLDELENKHQRKMLKHQSASEHHENILSKKNDIIIEKQDATREEKIRVAGLQQRLDEVTFALEAQKEKSEMRGRALKKALTEKMKSMEERQRLAVALQKAEDSCWRIEERQKMESEARLQHTSDIERLFMQQQAALDETTNSLHHLQQEFTSLSQMHSHTMQRYQNVERSYSPSKTTSREDSKVPTPQLQEYEPSEDRCPPETRLTPHCCMGPFK